MYVVYVAEIKVEIGIDEKDDNKDNDDNDESGGGGADPR